MSDRVELDSDDFILSFPLWILVPVITRVDRKRVAAEGFIQATADGIVCAVVFTDEDLARTFAKRNFPDQAAGLGLPDVAAFVKALKYCQSHKCDNCIFDPGPDGNKVRGPILISDILSQLRESGAS
jgi:hypothetical protein